MMRSLIILIGCLALGSGASQFFEPGMEYVYMMETSINTGTGDLSPHMSGFTVKGELRVQAEGDTLNIQIMNMRQSYFNGPYAAGYWPYQNMDARTKYIPVNEEYVEAIFSIIYENGKVKEITLADTSPLWLKNLMRGFASSFQIDMENVESGERAWYSKENTVHGECDVQYTFENSPQSDYHVVTKAVSHISDCINRSYKLFNNFYGKTCKNVQKFTPKVFNQMRSEEENLLDYVSELNQQYTSPEPMYSDSTTTIFMRPNDAGVYTVEKFFTAGAVVAHPFGKKGAAKWTLANRTFILKSSGPSSGNITIEGTTYEGVAFQWEENDRTWDTDVDIKEKEGFYHNGFQMEEDQETLWNALYMKIYDFVEEQKIHKTNYETKEDRDELHNNGVQQLLPLFYTLDFDSFIQMKEKIWEDESEEGNIAQDIFMELVPMAGTLPAAYLVKHMVMNSEYKNDRAAAKALTSMPFHIRKPTKGLVEEWEELISFEGEKFTLMAAKMSFAHLVRRTCELAAPQPFQKVQSDFNKLGQRKSECLEQLLNPMIEKYFEEFKVVDKKDINELNRYISMFANFKWGKISELLKPVIFGNTDEQYPAEVRAFAIFAVYENVIEDGADIEYFLPLVLDITEETEVRISAFKYLMKGNPDITAFVKIFTSMLHEPNFEVFNFIYTSFEKMAYSWEIEPCCKIQQQFARYYLKYWKEYMWVRPKYAFGVSKTYSRMFAQEKYGYSGSVEYSTIGQEFSATPDVYEMELRSQQFEGYAMQLFGVKIRMQGHVSQVMTNIIRQGLLDDDWNTDALKDILFEQMGVQERSEEDCQYELIISFKDTIIFQQFYDQDSYVEFFEYLMSFREHFSLKKQLAFSMGMVLYEQPSDIGFPVAFQAGVMSTMNVEFDVSNGKDVEEDAEDENDLFFRIFNYKLSYNGQASNSMTVFHQDNTAFSIKQDNVYKHQFGQWMKIAYNTNKMNLKVIFERPDYRRPASLILHSQTVVTITTNKLGDVPTALVKTCPTCQNVQVLTRGDEHKTGRYFVNIDSEEWGARVAGKYFDCEMKEASSEGEMLKILGEAFMTTNKEPKDFYTAITMGFRQINAYLTYFPKVESCGLKLMWSQSKYHPVTETVISLTGNTQDMQSGRRYSLTGDINLKGGVERKHHLAIKYEYENSRPDIGMLYDVFNKHSFNVKVGRKAFEVGSTNYPEYAVCLKFEQMYPVDSDKYFSLELNRPQKVSYEGAVSFGFDSSCSNHDQKINMKSKAATLRDSKKYLKSKWYYNRCMQEKKSSKYRSSRSFPLTDACFYTAEDLYTLRKFKTDITTNNIPRWLVKLFRKFEVVMKSKLWAYWQVDLKKQVSSVDYDNYSPWLRTDLVFNPETGIVDLSWVTNKENSEFKGMKYMDSFRYGHFIDDFLPSSSFSPAMKFLHNQDLMNYCTASTDEVRTYDNVTYGYQMHDCWTLLSADCSENPTFAVFMKKDDSKMALKLQMGGHFVEIKRSGYSMFEVTIDGEEVELDDQESFLFPSRNKVTGMVNEKYKFRIHKWENMFSVEIPFVIIVNFDGNQIQMTASPFLKGKQCGMCGDFNRNKRFEFMGPQECLLKDGIEMAAAYSWAGDDSCPEMPECSERGYSLPQIVNIQ